MKTFRASLALLLPAGIPLGAQDPVPVVTAPAAVTVGLRRTPEQLEQLLAPIALYPDALLAIILPAATAPADIVLAARHVRDFPGDRSQIEHRAWDESVKSLTHYPDVLRWLDENLDWTKQVGEAFAEQPADVMQTMQRLRAQARAAGTLVDTPQQQVIAEPDVIRIVPANPNFIYVPYYQPEVVFVTRPAFYSPSYFSFGFGVPVGSWLAFECDWRRHTIWVGNRHRHWTGHDWRRPLVGPVHTGPTYVREPDVRPWRPLPSASRHAPVTARTQYTEIVRPAPIRDVFNRPAGPPGSSSARYRNLPGQNVSTPIAPTQAHAPGVRGHYPAFRSTPASSTPALVTAPVVAPTVPTVVPAPPPATADRPAGNTPRHRAPRESTAQTAPAPSVVHAAPSAPPAPATSPGYAPSRSSSRPAAPAHSVPRTPVVTQPQQAPATEQSAPATNPPSTATPPRNDRGDSRHVGLRRNDT